MALFFLFVDPNYLSRVVLEKFVSKNIGYMNIDKIAYKFVHDEPKLLTCDNDVRQLLDLLVQRRQAELHLYVVHSIDISYFAGLADDLDYDNYEGEDDDYRVENSNDGVRDGDYGVNDSDDGVGDNVEEQSATGHADDKVFHNFEDVSNVGHVEDVAALSDFESSAGKEQPEFFQAIMIMMLRRRIRIM
ncbi:hypothetical protein CJ030_MR8G028817 [Morella rubra]|uniref:Uncharacterized protein n=1 Tax=Morella rubra TaxID=262757 RepID=A0A6A1UTU7_9ROSI|nr:hypothetical protein CJ030_MR8G028817 [Morella rubra]